MKKMEMNRNQTHSIPSLQGTLSKRTMLTLKPNFAKEPCSPSHANLIEQQCIMRLISDKMNECQRTTKYINHWAIDD